MAAQISRADTRKGTNSTAMRILKAELAVLERLGEPTLFDGITDAAARAGRLRAHLIAHRLVTAQWANWFERAYGEPLGDAP